MGPTRSVLHHLYRLLFGGQSSLGTLRTGRAGRGRSGRGRSAHGFIYLFRCFLSMRASDFLGLYIMVKWTAAQRPRQATRCACLRRTFRMSAVQGDIAHARSRRIIIQQKRTGLAGRNQLDRHPERNRDRELGKALSPATCPFYRACANFGYAFSRQEQRGSDSTASRGRPTAASATHATRRAEFRLREGNLSFGTVGLLVTGACRARPRNGQCVSRRGCARRNERAQGDPSQCTEPLVEKGPGDMR